MKRSQQKKLEAFKQFEVAQPKQKQVKGGTIGSVDVVDA